MPAAWVKRLDEIPRVPDDELRSPDWYPLQHYFRLTAFGANIFHARETGDDLIGEHDEAASGQEELYVVVAGEATFELDGESKAAPAVTVVCVRDPAVRRRAVAAAPGTTMLAVGGTPTDFTSTWRPDWFESVPRVS